MDTEEVPIKRQFTTDGMTDAQLAELARDLHPALIALQSLDRSITGRSAEWVFHEPDVLPERVWRHWETGPGYLCQFFLVSGVGGEVTDTLQVARADGRATSLQAFLFELLPQEAVEGFRWLVRVFVQSSSRPNRQISVNVYKIPDGRLSEPTDGLHFGPLT
jgi:hypothetical protein